MRRPERPARAFCLHVSSSLITILLAAGCDPSTASLLGLPAGLVGSSASSSSPLAAPLGAGFSSEYVEAEPNELLASASPSPLPPGGRATLRGVLAGDADVDTYALGSAAAGDRITITADADAGMTLAVGLFDEDEDLVDLVMDYGATGAPWSFETVCRETTGSLYAVVLSPTADRGTYEITLDRSTGVAATHSQIVLLDFDGASHVSIGGTAAVDVPPFDAGDIDARWAGQTETMKQKIVAKVRQHFDGLNVDIRSTDDGPLSAPHTTIYFGTYNAALLGLADSVDSYNQDPTESAIVFTDTFALFSVLNPTLDEIAQAIANVASHEMGHLLGLWHTTDVQDLMDVTATARQMLRMQTFRRAPLHPLVMPLGWQDGPSRLAWAVGGTLRQTGRNARAVTPPDDEWRAAYDFTIDRRLLSSRCR